MVLVGIIFNTVWALPGFLLDLITLDIISKKQIKDFQTFLVQLMGSSVSTLFEHLKYFILILPL